MTIGAMTMKIVLMTRYVVLTGLGGSSASAERFFSLSIIIKVLIMLKLDDHFAISAADLECQEIANCSMKSEMLYDRES